jgi:hypothetical protein
MISLSTFSACDLPVRTSTSISKAIRLSNSQRCVICLSKSLATLLVSGYFDNRLERDSNLEHVPLIPWLVRLHRILSVLLALLFQSGLPPCCTNLNPFLSVPFHGDLFCSISCSRPACSRVFPIQDEMKSFQIMCIVISLDKAAFHALFCQVPFACRPQSLRRHSSDSTLPIVVLRLRVSFSESWKGSKRLRRQMRRARAVLPSFPNAATSRSSPSVTPS